MFNLQNKMSRKGKQAQHRKKWKNLIEVLWLIITRLVSWNGVWLTHQCLKSFWVLSERNFFFSCHLTPSSALSFYHVIIVRIDLTCRRENNVRWCSIKREKGPPLDVVQMVEGSNKESFFQKTFDPGDHGLCSVWNRKINIAFEFTYVS